MEEKRALESEIQLLTDKRNRLFKDLAWVQNEIEEMTETRERLREVYLAESKALTEGRKLLEAREKRLQKYETIYSSN